MPGGLLSLAAAPSEAIAPSGEPRHGAFVGGLQEVGLSRAALPGLEGRLRRTLQRKRWNYVFAASEEAMVGAAVVEAGWFAAGFAWVLDRAVGSLVVDLSAAGIPGLNARVDDRLGDGARARFSGLGLKIDVVRREGRCELTMVGRSGFLAEVVLDTNGAPAPSALVTPVSGAGVRVTQKAAALRATGTIAIGRRTLLLDGGSGGFDATHGFLARETAWRWAFGTGRLPGGAPIAFNLAEGFAGVPEGDPGENALYRSFETSRLPPVTFAWDPRSPRSAWRVASADGSVDLIFKPEAQHREVKNFGVLRTRFSQLPGTFSGRLPGPGGNVTIDALPGVVEDHWAIW